MRRSEGTSDPPLWEQPLQGMNGSGFGADVEAFGGGFFDRVTGVGSSRDSYDTVEVQDCQSQLRACIQRISDVEAINVDLEARLESQAREYIELESDVTESQGAVSAPSPPSKMLILQVGVLEDSIRGYLGGGRKLEACKRSSTFVGVVVWF